MSKALKYRLKPTGEVVSLACGWNIKGNNKKHDQTAMCIIIVNIFLVRADDILFIESKVKALKYIVG